MWLSPGPPLHGSTHGRHQWRQKCLHRRFTCNYTAYSRDDPGARPAKIQVGGAARMLFQWWADVCDVGPPLGQHSANAWCDVGWPDPDAPNAAWSLDHLPISALPGFHLTPSYPYWAVLILAYFPQYPCVQPRQSPWVRTRGYQSSL